MGVCQVCKVIYRNDEAMKARVDEVEVRLRVGEVEVRLHVDEREQEEGTWLMQESKGGRHFRDD